MLKLNVGFSRKVGESNYGSRGASVNLELELDGGLVADPDKLKDRVRQMFLLAKASVDEELNGNSSPHVGNGHSGNGNGRSNNRRRDNTRRATASQVRALHAIADRNSINLAGVLQDRFGISQAEELTITEASSLIDELKSQTNGSGGKH
jgi:hypothetical protein